MNEDTDDLERGLRLWQPCETPLGLTHRIALALETPPPVAAHWWQRLGFSHLSAALGWGLAIPAATVAATLLLAPVSPPPSKSEPTQLLSAHTPQPPVSAWEPAVAKSRRLETSDEGVVIDQEQRPVRRTRYRSEDTLEWHDPRTGTSLQVSYPREDIVLTPVTTR